MMDRIMDPGTYPTEYSPDCSNCQTVFEKYKYLCVTCKAPCTNCTGRPTCNTSTDTYDFEKYLESLNRKPKLPLRVKTIGTDTCDLDSHFDYFKNERTTVIQKSVATDCADLNFRKLMNQKRTKREPKPSSNEVDCDFAWENESKTYSRSNKTKKSETGVDEPMLKLEENKENYDSLLDSDKGREVAFDETSSDESDIDLVTSSKVSKSRRIARTYNLTLSQTEINKEKVFKCCACGRTFPKKYLGILHLENHIEDGKYKCLTCESYFFSVDLLSSHVREAHRGLGTGNSDNIAGGDVEDKIGDENDANSDSKTNDKNVGGKQVDKGFQCVLCLNVNESPCRFPSYKALYLHKRMKHGETKRKPRLKREFICLFCGKEFKSNKALNDHLPVHTGEKNYLCDICNKSYTTSANLQIHKRTHMGLKNFKCTLCDKAFHKKDSLKVHFRKHSGERPFQCDLCPMRFDRNFILKNHRLRHFAEKTYICPVCGKAFTTHGGLNSHEKSHKRDPGSKKPRKPAVKPTLDTENAVICDVCGKVYSTRSNLRIHKFVHLGLKPFQCPVCQQSYAKKDSMLTHMRKHTDERPFSCETCGMAFYRNHTLKTHRLRHTGERPHKCHMCGKSFTQSSSLTYHIKHHSRKEEKKKVHFMEDQNKTHRKKKFAGTKAKANVKDVPEIMNEMAVLNDENNLEFGKTTSLMVPVIKKEVLVLDENLTVEKKDERAPEGYEPDKDNNQFGLNKLNYFIPAKNQVIPVAKTKTFMKDDEKAGDIEGENLILPKNPIVRDETMLLNREIWPKTLKADYTEGMEPKVENVLPITGEILNATFISDGNGEVIPFGSMTLQSVNAENIMISPLIKLETGDEADRRKGIARGGSRLTVIDSKVKYHPASSGKSVAKANCQILNLKDSRMQQRIQLINSEPLSFHIQVPVSCTAVADETVLNGLSSAATYYSSV